MEKTGVTKIGATLVPDDMTVAACRESLAALWASENGPQEHTLYPVMLQGPYAYLPEMIEGFVPVDFSDIRESIKHLNFGESVEVAGVSELFVFIRPVSMNTGERVLAISPEQRKETEACWNFVPVAQYGSREPEPQEIGYLASSVTLFTGIGHNYARKFGPVLCRVEMAE